MDHHPQALSNPGTSRKRLLSLAIIALALASLACFNTELTLTITQQEDSVDTLDVTYQQFLIPSYVEAAKSANEERAADFQAAGRDPGEPLLPTTREELADAFDIQKYQDQGYEIQETETGFSATRTYTLNKDRIKEEWIVRVFQNPDHPELITYRVKVYLDLSDTDLEDLQKLRNEPLMEKQDPNNTEGNYSGGSGFIGGLVSSAAGLADAAEGQLAIELYYVQKALQNSQPMQNTIVITLPGEIVFHKLNGTTAGVMDGNTVILVVTEADMAANSGKKLVFHVESILKDCTKACNEESQPHLIWDGDEEGVSCNCVCEEGYEVIKGERACINCDTVCSWSDPNLVTDLAACEVNQCGCRCGDGYEINNAGTKCITTAEAEAEDNQRGADGGPSKTEIGGVVTALILGMEGSDVSQLPGWLLMTPTEREELLAVVEALGITVDRSNLIVDKGPDMTPEERIQRMEEEQKRLQRLEELAIEEVAQQIQDRRVIQEQIIKEIGGMSVLGQYLVKIPDYYQKLSQTPYQLASGYVKGQMTDEAKKRLLQETHGGSPATLEAAAAELIKQIPYLATNGCVDDYYLYKELYANYCQGCQGNDADLAHEQAMEELQKRLKDSYYGTGRANWAKPGEAYDRAFSALNSAGK